MSTYQPLDCDLHDYLEIACMHRYDLRIELLGGASFVAKALTTYTTASKEEFIVLQDDAGRYEVRLDRLMAITALDANADFGRVVLHP